MKLYIIDRLEQIKFEDIEFILEYLPKNRLEKYKRITNLDYKKSSLMGYILLVLMIKEEYGIYYFPDWEEGIKPYDENLGFHFNITHSTDIVACAISDIEIGIDIEVYRNFDERVIKGIHNDGDGEIKKDFVSQTEYWTKKESIIKMLGGSVFNMHKININDYNTHSYHNRQYDYVLSITIK